MDTQFGSLGDLDLTVRNPPPLTARGQEAAVHFTLGPSKECVNAGYDFDKTPTLVYTCIVGAGNS